MIGLVLGTSEGKYILERLNEYTDDLFISASSRYGSSIYESYRYRIVNSKPLDKVGFVRSIQKNNISMFIDTSHPFAKEVSKNLREACAQCDIRYLRYDRPGVYGEYENESLVVGISSYEDIRDELEGITGTVLNTTGSNNAGRIMNLGIPNRIVHRVLPIPEVLVKLNDAGIKTEDIVAMKMEAGVRGINEALINVYDAKAVITKDSGKAGGTVEKIEAYLALSIKCIVILKETAQDYDVFNDLNELIDDIVEEAGL